MVLFLYLVRLISRCCILYIDDFFVGEGKMFSLLEKFSVIFRAIPKKIFTPANIKSSMYICVSSSWFFNVV